MNKSKIAVQIQNYTLSTRQQKLIDAGISGFFNFGLSSDEDIQQHVFYSSWDSCHLLFKIAAVKLVQWEQKQREAHKETNPKRAGRPKADLLVVFIILFFQKMQGYSLVNMLQHHLRFDLLLRSAIFSHLGEQVDFPKRTTLMKYQELFSKDGVIEDIFMTHTDILQGKAAFYLNNASNEYEDISVGEVGAIDASFFEVNRYKKSQNKTAGSKKDSDKSQEKSAGINKASERQIDPDAKWTIKRNCAYHGYKGTFIIDVASGMITVVTLVSANCHDITQLKDACKKLPSSMKNMKKLLADSGYASKKIQSELLQEHNVNLVHSKRPYKNKPLTQLDIEHNHQVSHLRITIEHTFAHIKNDQKFRIRTKRKIKATGELLMAVIAHNVLRMQGIIDGRVHKVRTKSAIDAAQKHTQVKTS